MATIHVRNVPEPVALGVKALARAHRRSMDAEVLEILDPASVGVPAGVLAELLYGKYNNPDRAAKLDVLIADMRASYPVLPFDAGAADWFGRLKHRLKATMIQDRDLLIASTALAHGYALVTHNTKHFQRIDELVLLDWTVPI